MAILSIQVAQMWNFGAGPFAWSRSDVHTSKLHTPGKGGSSHMSISQSPLEDDEAAEDFTDIDRRSLSVSIPSLEVAASRAS